MNETNQENVEAVKAIELAKDLQSLQQDPRFKRVILEGFIDRILNEESMYLVYSDRMHETVGKINAVNYLKLYMEYVVNVANGIMEDVK